MTGPIARLAYAFALLFAGASPGTTAPAQKWTSAWASAQMVPDKNNELPNGALRDATLRQVVRTTIAGDRLRVRISNAFGTAPLLIGAASIARAASVDSPRILPGSARTLTFAGRPEVAVPAGAEYLSDPIAMPVPALTDLMISLHVADHPARQTSHPGSRATSYIAPGNQVAAANLPAATKTDHWFLLSGIDVVGGTGAIAIIGDSITDGNGVLPNTNQRWPDFLMARLQANPRTRGLSVLNLGIGGNRLLNDGLGPNTMARFDRDVLARNNVRYLIVFEGVNDLGTLTREAPVSAAEHDIHVARMIAAYRQIVDRARERGIKVIGATISPFMGFEYYHPTAVNETDRQKVNAWIRSPGNFDAVIDFDKLLRDPSRPDRLLPQYDKGDGIHPSIAGYRAMGNAVPLSLFVGR